MMRYSTQGRFLITCLCYGARDGAEVVSYCPPQELSPPIQTIYSHKTYQKHNSSQKGRTGSSQEVTFNLIHWLGAQLFVLNLKNECTCRICDKGGSPSEVTGISQLVKNITPQSMGCGFKFHCRRVVFSGMGF